MGTQLKYITEGITDANTAWVAADIGTQFNTGLYGVTIGGAIRNVGKSSRAGGALLQRVIQTTDGSQLQEGRRVDLWTRPTELPVAFQFSLGSQILGSADALFDGTRGAERLLRGRTALTAAGGLALAVMVSLSAGSSVLRAATPRGRRATRALTYGVWAGVAWSMRAWLDHAR